MKIEQVMTSCPTFATTATTLADVARMMVDQDCGQIPVLGGDSGRRPLGVVTDRDIVVRALAKGRNPMELKAGDVMSTPCITVASDDELSVCTDAMEREQIRRVLVVDKAGDLCGIVAQADVARSAQGDLTAEVVKQISEPKSDS